MNHRVDRIRECLSQALQPTHLELFDDSAAHAGHAGAQERGGGHFSAVIVSEAFTGQPLVARHQQVYRSLGTLMQTDIHAFSMRVYTPSEFDFLEHQQPSNKE